MSSRRATTSILWDDTVEDGCWQTFEVLFRRSLKIDLIHSGNLFYLPKYFSSETFFLKRLDNRDKIRYDTNDLIIHRPYQPVGSSEGGRP
jgi:hypothetical protein